MVAVGAAAARRTVLLGKAMEKHGGRGAHQLSARGLDKFVTCWGLLVLHIKAFPEDGRNTLHIRGVLAEHQGMLQVVRWSAAFGTHDVGGRWTPMDVIASSAARILAEVTWSQDRGKPAGCVLPHRQQRAALCPPPDQKTHVQPRRSRNNAYCY